MNLRRRMFYMSGQIGMMSLARFIFQWILKYAASEAPDSDLTGARTVLFSATLVGSILFGFRIFDGLTDPVAGALSDSWVRRGRQRRSLLWLPISLPCAGLVLCFLPSHETAPGLGWALLAGGMFVFFVGYTFYAIPYWSLLDDYAGSDVAERRILSNLLGAGLLIATGLGFVVSPLLVEAYGYTTSAVIFAVPALFLMILPYFAAPPAMESRHRDGDQNGGFRHFGKTLVETLKHRRFLAVLIMFSGSQMSFTILTAAAPFIAQSLLEGTEGDVAWIMGPLLGAAILCFLFVPWCSRTFGWERGMMVASVALGVVYLLSAALGRGVIGSPMTTAMIIFACGGPMIAVLLGLEGQAITECARERGGEAVSIYFGVFNFVVKSLNGLAILGAGILVDLSRSGWGTTAIRFMSVAAGGCLFLCVAIYFLVRPARRGADA